ncbi:MAG: TetR family transcriptional regulator [Acidimicrobiales bacterium]
MGYKYSQDEILAAAVEAVAEDGLSKLTFGRLAKRMGINDRTIVYYFPSKTDLVSATVAAIGEELIDMLDDAFGNEPLPPEQLTRRAWPAVSAPSNEVVFRAFFELIGLSGAGIEPFATLAPALLTAWAEWLVPYIDVPPGSTAEAEAHRIMATLDGLLIIQSQLGHDASAAAARAMDL